MVAELTVIIALFGTGLRIDDLSSLTRWGPTIRLLAVAMPLTILTVAAMSYTFAGMTVAGAVFAERSTPSIPQRARPEPAGAIRTVIAKLGPLRALSGHMMLVEKAVCSIPRQSSVLDPFCDDLVRRCASQRS